jgi:hypothetical protein
MKRTISLLAAVFAMLAAPAAGKSVPAAVMAPISAMLAATNADKGAELAAYYILRTPSSWTSSRRTHGPARRLLPSGGPA